ncbi:LysR family transcriptional regulator [Azoarcus sp. TTM-91]|nr:LysR family transcriptional regulator [Azoarcus sp. TTM-91]
MMAPWVQGDYRPRRLRRQGLRCGCPCCHDGGRRKPMDARLPEPLPPLHALLAFEALGRLRSVAAAIHELRVSRAALSRSIVLLEHRVKLRLVLRYSPAVALSTAGEAYFRAVQRFALGLADELQALSPSAVAELRVAATPGFARLWLAPRLAGLAHRLPWLRLRLSVSENLADLAGGEAELAIRYCEAVDPPFEALPLWRDEAIALACPTLASTARLLSPAALVRELPLVAHPSFPWRDFAPEAEERPLLICHDLVFVLEAAARGDGIALVPGRLAADFARAHDLVQAHERRLPARRYQLVAPVGALQRPAARAFSDWLLEEVAGSVAE